MPERFESIPEDMKLIDMLDPQRFDMYEVFKEFARAVRGTLGGRPSLLDAVREGLRHNLGNYVHQGLGLTLLHCAAEAGNHDVVIAITEHDGNAVGLNDIHGLTPLHYAAKNAWKARKNSAGVGCFAGIIRTLIKRGAYPDTSDMSGMTPLHLAAAAPGTPGEIVLALIDAGADPGARDSKGNTPLHTAALNHSGVDAIKAFAERKVDFDAVNDDGRTPHDLAAMNHNMINVDYFEFLLGNSDRDPTEIRRSAPASLAERAGERAGERVRLAWES